VYDRFECIACPIRPSQQSHPAFNVQHTLARGRYTRPDMRVECCRGGFEQTRSGDFDLAPAPGQELIRRNYGIRPSFLSVNLGISRSFAFGNVSAPAAAGAAKPAAPVKRSRRRLRRRNRERITKGWSSSRKSDTRFTFSVTFKIRSTAPTCPNRLAISARAVESRSLLRAFLVLDQAAVPPPGTAAFKSRCGLVSSRGLHEQRG
jgi:hypothetical protein